MHAGMSFFEFKEEWLAHFAKGISKKDIENKVVKTGNYLWHIFSWELVDADKYLFGEKARQAFDSHSIIDAWYIIPFDKNKSVKAFNYEKISAEQLEKETEIYVVAKDFSWTYIKTHEEDICGPYYFKKPL